MDRFETIPPFAIEQGASRGSDDGLHAAGLQQCSVDESAGREARGAADRVGLVRAHTARAIGSSVTDTVLADVLVGDDGLARAVRFVRPAADQEQMP